MIITLQNLPPLLGPKDDGYNGLLPARARFLSPDAAESLLSMDDEKHLVFTDCYRSPAAILQAYRTKPGTQRPAYSTHGYGLAVDIDVQASCHLNDWSYAQLSDFMSGHGWWCYRRDLDSTASESWHFSYYGDKAKEFLSYVDPQNHLTWARAPEALIHDRFGDQFALDAFGIQTALTQLKFYSGGSIDGIVGPATSAAIRDFQETWDLTADGIAGAMTTRTLAFCAAMIDIQPPLTA